MLFALDIERQRREAETSRRATGLGTVRIDEPGDAIIEEQLRIECDLIAVETGAEIDRDHAVSSFISTPNMSRALIEMPSRRRMSACHGL